MINTESIHFIIKVMPISQQAKGNKKREVYKELIDKCKEFEYLIGNEVKVEITWYSTEKNRFLYHKSPDVDNIIKPILDIISGPDGIIIDDRQVQSINCSWIDCDTGNERVEISIRPFDNIRYKKKNLILIEFMNGYCIPRSIDSVEIFIKVFLDYYIKYIEFMNNDANDEEDYIRIISNLPMQMVFHKNKLSKFKITNIKDIHKS